jgi:hypothetical protein
LQRPSAQRQALYLYLAMKGWMAAGGHSGRFVVLNGSSRNGSGLIPRGEASPWIMVGRCPRIGGNGPRAVRPALVQ